MSYNTRIGWIHHGIYKNTHGSEWTDKCRLMRVWDRWGGRCQVVPFHYINYSMRTESQRKYELNDLLQMYPSRWIIKASIGFFSFFSYLKKQNIAWQHSDTKFYEKKKWKRFMEQVQFQSIAQCTFISFLQWFKVLNLIAVGHPI